MTSKAVAAIVIVAMVAITGGVAAAVIIDNNSSLNVDKAISVNDIKAGNYVKFGMETNVVMTDSAVKTTDDFVSNLYIGRNVPGGTSIPYEYKGTIYDCMRRTAEIDGTQFVFYVKPDTGVTFFWNMTTSENFASYSLIDTNLDVTKTLDVQKSAVANGSYMKYQVVLYENGNEFQTNTLGTYEMRMTDYNGTSGTCVNTTTAKAENDEVLWKVTEINSEGKVVLDSIKKQMTKGSFLSCIDYDTAIKTMADEGYSVTHGQKVQKTIDTPFGKRNVTVEKVTAVKDTVTSETTFTYGEKGFIYITETHETGPDKVIDGIVTITGTDMIVQ